MPRPELLPPNLVPRFYRGGPAIAALRGVPLPGERVPEEWIASATHVLGDEHGLGLSRLADGRLLRDAVAAEPAAWLGAAHADRFGPSPGLLVKLLDAGERLPVHLHPSGPFAREHLDEQPLGKTEAWIVAGGTGEVHVGWRADVSAEALRGWVEAQDVDAMLAAMHRVDVGPGDALFVPAGVAHAIGAGLLIVEVQEPSDLGVMLEWEGHDVGGPDAAALGLGWNLALTAVDRTAADPAALAGPREGTRLLPPAADAFFRADRLRGGDGLPAGFAVLVVLAGAGRLVAGAGTLDLARGAAAVVPFAAGDWSLDGDLEAVCCRPPDPARAASAMSVP